MKETCKHKGYLEQEYVTTYLSQNLNYIMRTNIKRLKKSQCIHEGRNVMLPPDLS